MCVCVCVCQVDATIPIANNYPTLKRISPPRDALLMINTNKDASIFTLKCFQNSPKMRTFDLNI